MATTRLDLSGAGAAYLEFSPKSASSEIQQDTTTYLNVPPQWRIHRLDLKPRSEEKA